MQDPRIDVQGTVGGRPISEGDVTSVLKTDVNNAAQQHAAAAHRGENGQSASMTLAEHELYSLGGRPG
jgi:hypothetical protein